MAEYMSREDYCEVTCGKENREGYKTCYNCGMLNVPTVDVQPVVHSKWITTGDGTYNAYCEHCGQERGSKAWNKNDFKYCFGCGARMDGDVEVKTINRAVARGKPLDEDCKTANVSTHEFGPNDNRCFCYGLYVPCNDWEIQQKCLECKAYVENAEPPKDGEING